MGKRIVSLLLAVLMMTTLLPVQVWAAEMTDSGNEVEDAIVLEEEAVIPQEESELEEQEPQEKLPESIRKMASPWISPPVSWRTAAFLWPARPLWLPATAAAKAMARISPGRWIVKGC